MQTNLLLLTPKQQKVAKKKKVLLYTFKFTNLNIYYILEYVYLGDHLNEMT